ncbi:hypothetical protein Tco_1315554 [Tanacetum coccineum]
MSNRTPLDHDLVGQHAIFTEHISSAATHLCPYIAYVQPVHPSSSSSASSASVADGPTYNNNQWNSQSASGEMPNSYGLPTVDVRYHTLFPTSNNRVGVVGADQPSMPSNMPRRPARTNPDMPRSSGSYVHPFIVGQSSAARAPSVIGSSMIHPYPGSAARARERNQALQAYYQQPSNLPGLRTPMVSGSRRSNSQAQMGQVGSSSDQIRGGIYYLPTSGSSNARNGFQEAESSVPNTFHHTWERDPQLMPGWGFHQAGGGGGGSGAIFRQRHGSERAPSQVGGFAYGLLQRLDTVNGLEMSPFAALFIGLCDGLWLRCPRDIKYVFIDIQPKIYKLICFSVYDLVLTAELETFQLCSYFMFSQQTDLLNSLQT